ncbi:MAG: exosortase family protein XrtF [Bergeyella zoohelcum]|nr:exosortase family protein XrtF [Bergeyella zoohelcum]
MLKNTYLCCMFNDFKPAFGILLRFLIIYLILLGIYQFYLNQYSDSLDPASIWMAERVTDLQNTLGYPSSLTPMPEKQSYYFYVSGAYRTRMIEGCNSLSIMILFVAFVMAFYRGYKTFIFTFLGLAFLLITNILRIAGINIVGVISEEYFKIAHDYFFPAIIYGGVVLLWLIWIKFYTLKENENH